MEADIGSTVRQNDSVITPKRTPKIMCALGVYKNLYQCQFVKSFRAQIAVFLDEKARLSSSLSTSAALEDWLGILGSSRKEMCTLFVYNAENHWPRIDILQTYKGNIGNNRVPCCQKTASNGIVLEKKWKACENKSKKSPTHPKPLVLHKSEEMIYI